MPELPITLNVLVSLETVTAAVAPVVAAMKELAAVLERQTRAAYIEAGAPYGATDEGLAQWIAERNAAALAAFGFDEETDHNAAIEG